MLCHIAKPYKNMFNILVVEDDENLRKLMTAVLRRNRYNVLQAGDGKEALDIIESNHVDMMVCDIMLPGMDGYEVTREIRLTNSEMPILIVTARETLEDKRRGFAVGTDDYMVKPINMDEMLMRISALLRRAKITSERRITVGGTDVDMDAMTVNYNGEQMQLPKKEFFILFKLLSMPNHIFTRHALMEEIWGPDAETDERTVDVHIKRLRERLEEAGIKDFEIITVRGLGYKAVKNV